jgi:hypothetical protein
MPRSAIRDLSVSTRIEARGGAGERYVDLRVDFTADSTCPDPGEVLLSVGGRWDKLEKRYAGEAEERVAFTMHPGQLDAVRFFRRWCEARVRRQQMQVAVTTPDGAQLQRALWSCLCAGGRRGGKTDFCVKCCVAMAVLVPGSKVWAISESIPKTEELDDVISGLIPRSWAKSLGAPWHRYTFVNGSTLHLRSAHDPEVLKRGRCDFGFFNEAQNIAERAYTIVRAAIADTGGIVLMAANPPEEPIGQWVADVYEETKAGRRASRLIEFDAKRNPHVMTGALEDMRHEVDERTYRVEILGEFLARQDVVWYNWSPRENVRPAPETPCCTQLFTRRHLARPFPAFVGADFQLSPHMAATVWRAWPDPDDPREALLWVVDEVVVENGDENDLIDALELKGLDGRETAVVADASGEWQDAERTVGRGSYDVFRRRGWKFIYTPDKNSKRNPLILERCAAANVRIRTADGRRHVFSSPDNYHLNRALRLWENRNGVPHRRSEYAHLSDAFSYPLWRFYPRRVQSGSVQVTTIARERGAPGPRRTGGRARDLTGY